MSIIKLAKNVDPDKETNSFDRAVAGSLIAAPGSLIWGATKEGMKRSVVPSRTKVQSLRGVGRTTSLGLLSGAAISPVGQTIDNFNQNIGKTVYDNQQDRDNEMKQKMIGAATTGGIIGSVGGPIGSVVAGSVAAGEAGLNTKLEQKSGEIRRQIGKGLKAYKDELVRKEAERRMKND